MYLTPQGREAAAEAAFGIYGKTGDVDKAVELATGGIMDFNGAKIARPYGWTKGRFRDALAGEVARRVERSTLEFIVGGRSIPSDEFSKTLSGARLQTVGNGAYFVMDGNRPVLDATSGQPYILKVTP